MRKLFRIISAFILLLLVTYFIINSFDEDLNPGNYSFKDLPAATFSIDNGFHYIFWLMLKEGQDPLSEEKIDIVKKLFHPIDRDEEFLRTFDEKSLKGDYSDLRPLIGSLKFPAVEENKWIEKLSSRKDLIEKALKMYKTPMSRFKAAMSAPYCSDFVYPEYRSPIPDGLAVLDHGKLYIASRLINPEKNWQKSVADIIRYTNFSKRVAGSSRNLISSLFFKANVRAGLKALNEIMNHKDCPEAVYQMVFNGLSPIEYSDYGSFVPLVSECLLGFSMVDITLDDIEGDGDGNPWYLKIMPGNILLHRNRTKNNFNRVYRKLIEYDRTAPWKWDADMEELKDKVNPVSRLWWLRNAAGKILYTLIPDLNSILNRNLRLKAEYDMTRIHAEFRHKYKNGEEFGKVKESLESFRVVDSCSGKAYRWNSEKSLIYSIGIDREDNSGKQNRKLMRGADYSVEILKKSSAEED